MEGSAKRIFALCSLTALAMLSISGSLAQQTTYIGPSILPPAPGAIDGGNPFQGLGRSDDPGASREGQYGFPTYNNSNFNAHGMNDRPAPVRYSDSYAEYPHTDDPPFRSGSGSSSPTFNPTSGLWLEPGSSSKSNSSSVFSRTSNTNLSQGYQPGSDYSSGGNSVFGGNGNQIPGGFIPTSMLDSPSSSSNSQIGSPNVIQGPTQPTYGQAASGLGFPGAGGTLPGTGYANQGTGYGASSQFAPGFGGQAGFGSSPSTGAGAGAGAGAGPGLGGGPGPGFGGGAGTSSGPGSGLGTAMGAGDPSQSIFQNQDNSGNRSKNERGENRGETRDGGNRGGNDLGGGASSSQSSLLSPPPSMSANASSIADPLSFSDRDSARTGRQMKTSLGATLDEIKLGRLPDALKSVNQVLQADAANANAHYLKAVICVLMRNFEEAKKEYDQTIKLSRNEQLTGRAKLGLAKLGR